MMIDMRIRRAREVAESIVAWRQQPRYPLPTNIPDRFMTDPAWREKHLLGPRDREVLRFLREHPPVNWPGV